MVNEIKRKGVKNTLLKLGVALLTAIGLSGFVSAGFVQKINGLNYILGGATEKNSGQIDYDVDGYPEKITVAGREITPTYTNGVLTKVEDQNFEKSFTYGATSTSWVTTKK